MDETGESEPERQPGHDEEHVQEFGGRLGVLGILVASHLLPFTMWLAWRFHDGAAPHPDGLGDLVPWIGRMAGLIADHATPTASSVGVYLGFLALQALLAATLPGIRIQGLPIPSEGGRQLTYLCNGIWAWYATLAGVAALHLTGTFRLEWVAEHFGELLTTAMIVADLVAVAVYVGAFLARTTHRMSGDHLVDFFMGAWLNPRIGPLDLKMWAEIRVSWMLLFLLTASAAAWQVAQHGALSTPMIFMLVAHGLYANACMKGEECIPTTWDIFYEKWGWMLVYWNLAGVPFVYCFSSFWIASRPPFEHGVPYTILCFVLLFCAYYVWDTAQSQRNRFRMRERGTYVKRLAFPQLPWGTLTNPRVITTKAGSKLLIDGWWAYARKIHYTADIVMALTWGLITGFTHVLPYLYAAFFLVMITHRATRDIARCRRKYGDDWDRYTKEVPWLLVPYVF
ncbi:MAG: delta(24(24(1)))-sterol reductase [Alphaproteobacteria bacterium]|nr:delta(24(24(1)))-sterol reductase [Alphaproteobacteria bacterium]